MLPAPEAARASAWRAGLALTVAVTAVHLWLAGQLVPARLGDGAGADDGPARIAVAFVRELAPAAPAVRGPAAAPRPRAAQADVAGRSAGRAAARAELAASAPQAPAQSEPSPVPDALAPPSPDLAPALALPPPAAVDGPPPLLAAAAPAVASSAASASAAGPAATADASAPAFDWPPSTRLSYRLNGNFRGPVDGQAQVEWLRSGTRYQVHLDVSVGPAFAPLMRRRISSAGEITAEGMRPERFDEETRMLWRDPRQLRIEMGPDLVRLARGEPWARPAGLQDTASQFVQLTWLFTVRPELLQPGQRVPLPLALPRRIQLWQYEVGNSETLDTPAGPVVAVHVRPRPDAASEARRGGDLVPEAWFAPSLQYLPVRIFIRQDEENFINLVLDRLPQQAEPGR